MIRLLILVSLSLHSSYSVPVAPAGTCAQKCVGSAKFGYEVGKTYNYEYNAAMKTMAVDRKEYSGVLSSGSVEIFIKSACEHILKMKDIEIKLEDESGGANPFPESPTYKAALQEFNLPFSFQDGVVDSVCPHANEKVWALNFKRSIISALQNGMAHFERSYDVRRDEDISGECKTEYVLSQAAVAPGASSTGYNVDITRSKDLLTCTDRTKNFDLTRAKDYNKPLAAIQSLPAGKSQCEQSIKNSVVRDVICEETLQWEGQSPVMVKNKLSLKAKSPSFVTTATLSSSGSAGAKSLVYEHHQLEGTTKTDAAKAKKALDDLCKATKDGDISEDVPNKFNTLIDSLKGLSVSDISDIQKEAKTKQDCPLIVKMYHEALSLTNKAEAIEFLSKQLPNYRRDSMKWIRNIASRPRPDPKSITFIHHMLKNHARCKKTALYSGSIVYSHCLDVGAQQCLQTPGVKEIVQELESRVYCDGSKTNDIKSIVALKALGNIGVGFNTVKLDKCISNKALPMEVRSAAIDSFRRFDCGEMMKVNTNKKILDDAEEDSELRIQAYLNCMRCGHLDEEDLTDILEKGQSNQLGHFVWTHLRNLRRSKSPHDWAIKKVIKNVIRNAEFKKLFPNNANKFSRNVENSFYSRSSSVGANIESNLIMSEKSMIPRQGNLNLTVYLYGQSFNIFEVSARAEGLETLLEEPLRTWDKYSHQRYRKIFSRRPRSLSANTLSSILQGYGYKPSPPSMKVSYKVLGDEVGHVDILRTWANNKQEVSSLATSLSKSKDTKFNRNHQILDSRKYIANIVGMPMSVAVKATASINFNMKTDINAEDYTKEFLLSNDYRPSGALELITRVGCTSPLKPTDWVGLKAVTTLSTNTASKSSVTYETTGDKREFEMKLEVPKEKNNFLTFRTSAFISTNTGKPAQLTGTETTKEYCSGNMMKEMGAKVCTKVSYSSQGKAPYMLAGPMSLEMTMEKDKSLSAYSLKMNYQPDETSAAFSAVGMPDPDKMSMKIARSGGKADITLKALSKKLEISGTLLKNKQADMTVKLNGKQLLKIGGDLEFVPKQMLKADLTIETPIKKDAKFKIDLQRKPTSISLFLHSETLYFTARTDTSVHLINTGYIFDSKNYYQWKKQSPHNFEIYNKIVRRIEKDNYVFETTGAFASDKYSVFNSNFSSEVVSINDGKKKEWKVLLLALAAGREYKAEAVAQNQLPGYVGARLEAKSPEGNVKIAAEQYTNMPDKANFDLKQTVLMDLNDASLYRHELKLMKKGTIGQLKSNQENSLVVNFAGKPQFIYKQTVDLDLGEFKSTSHVSIPRYPQSTGTTTLLINYRSPKEAKLEFEWKSNDGRKVVKFSAVGEDQFTTWSDLHYSKSFTTNWKLNVAYPGYAKTARISYEHTNQDSQASMDQQCRFKLKDLGSGKVVVDESLKFKFSINPFTLTVNHECTLDLGSINGKFGFNIDGKYAKTVKGIHEGFLETDFFYNDRKIEMKLLEGSFSSGDTTVAKGKLILTTPFPKMKEFSWEADFKHKSKEELKLTNIWQLNGKKLDAVAAINVRNKAITSSYGSLTIKTPFPRVKKIVYSFDRDFTDYSNIQNTETLEINGVKKIDITFTGKHKKATEFELSVSGSTFGKPVNGKTSFEYELKSSSPLDVKFEMKTTYGNGQKFEVKGKMQSRKKFEFKIETPFKYWEEVAFEHKRERDIVHPLIGFQYHCETKLKLPRYPKLNGGEVEYKFDLVVPKSIKAPIFQFDVKFEHPLKKGDFKDFELKNRILLDDYIFNTQLEVDAKGKKYDGYLYKMEIKKKTGETGGELRLESISKILRKFEVSAGFKPIPGSANFKVKYDGLTDFEVAGKGKMIESPPEYTQQNAKWCEAKFEYKTDSKTQFEAKYVGGVNYATKFLSGKLDIEKSDDTLQLSLIADKASLTSKAKWNKGKDSMGAQIKKLSPAIAGNEFGLIIRLDSFTGKDVFFMKAAANEAAFRRSLTDTRVRLLQFKHCPSCAAINDCTDCHNTGSIKPKNAFKLRAESKGSPYSATNPREATYTFKTTFLLPMEFKHTDKLTILPGEQFSYGFTCNMMNKMVAYDIDMRDKLKTAGGKSFNYTITQNLKTDLFSKNAGDKWSVKKTVFYAFDGKFMRNFGVMEDGVMDKKRYVFWFFHQCDMANRELITMMTYPTASPSGSVFDYTQRRIDFIWKISPTANGMEVDGTHFYGAKDPVKWSATVRKYDNEIDIRFFKNTADRNDFAGIVLRRVYPDSLTLNVFRKKSGVVSNFISARLTMKSKKWLQGNLFFNMPLFQQLKAKAMKAGAFSRQQPSLYGAITRTSGYIAIAQINTQAQFTKQLAALQSQSRKWLGSIVKDHSAQLNKLAAQTNKMVNYLPGIQYLQQLKSKAASKISNAKARFIPNIKPPTAYFKGPTSGSWYSKLYKFVQAPEALPKYKEMMSQLDDILATGELFQNRFKKARQEMAPQWKKMEMKYGLDKIDEYQTLKKLFTDVRQSVETKMDQTKMRAWIKSNIETKLKTFIRHLIPNYKVSKMDLKAFEVQVDLYLPVSVNILKGRMPRLRSGLKLRRKIFGMFKPAFPSYYRPNPRMKIMASANPGFAALAGDQHYLTFDKKSYQFIGDCTYLLATDFKNQEFTVMVQYKKEGGKSVVDRFILQLAKNSRQVEIVKSTKEVIVDSQVVQLPVHLSSQGNRKDFQIIRTRHSIKVNNIGRHIYFSWDFANDVAILKISGWFHGRTAGLFGTFDNEEHNDFTMSDRKRTTSATDMAYSWKVSSSCSKSNFAKDLSIADPVQEGEAKATCDKHFKSWFSPLRQCFASVPVESFYERCLFESKEGNNVCKSVAFYIHICKRRGTWLQAPKSCEAKCESEGKLKDGASSPGQDVVFVYEENDDCAAITPDQLKQFANTIDKSGGNNRFGLVGFGSSVFDKPHIHTVGGDMFGSVSQLSAAIDSLKDDVNDGAKVGNGDNNQFKAALNYLLREYPFTADKKQTIVMSLCQTTCGTKMSGEIKGIVRKLKDRQINLHILSGQNSRQAIIYQGFQKNGADSICEYERSGPSACSGGGNSVVSKQPRNQCVETVENMDYGSFYLGDGWDTFKIEGRAVKDLASSSIQNSSYRRSMLNCYCEHDRFGYPLTVCSTRSWWKLW